MIKVGSVSQWWSTSKLWAPLLPDVQLECAHCGWTGVPTKFPPHMLTCELHPPKDRDPVDVHRALQKAARELAFYADNGHHTEYFAAIDQLEAKLKAVRGLSGVVGNQP